MIWINSPSESAVDRSRKSRWSVIIPAAGAGSRLQHSAPKILFPVHGKSVLEWMLASLAQHVDEAVLVVSPSGEPLIREALNNLSLKPAHVRCVIQPEPRGMADAVHLGLLRTESENTFVIWGDQPFVRRSTLNVLSEAQETEQLSGVIAFVDKPQPYVHYAVDSAGALTQVLQRREGDVLPETGRSDVGCFAFHRKSLLQILQSSVVSKGQSTQEWNLLPEIPRLEKMRQGLGGFQVGSDAPELISINTPAEAAIAREWAEKHADFLKENSR